MAGDRHSIDRLARRVARATARSARVVVLGAAAALPSAHAVTPRAAMASPVAPTTPPPPTAQEAPPTATRDAPVPEETAETTLSNRPQTPDDALAALLDGNVRFVEGRPKAHTLDVVRESLAAGQSPFAAVIRCADSRVAPELCFDQALGELFVCGVAGNVPTPEIIASLEYGVDVLGTNLIVVMGHSSCGAVEAALAHRNDTSVLPGSLPLLVNQILSPCAMNLDPDDPDSLEAATACNANLGVEELLKRSPVIADAVKAGALRVVAGVLDLESGVFRVTRPGS